MILTVILQEYDQALRTHVEKAVDYNDVKEFKFVNSFMEVHHNNGDIVGFRMQNILRYNLVQE